MLIDSRILKHAIATVMPSRTEVFLIIDGMPDAIVRCKDCKHRDPEDHKCDCGHDIQWQLPRADDWFCADGVKWE